MNIYLGTFAGKDGSRQPTQLELQMAEHEGSYFTQVATALKIGRAALSSKKDDERPPSAKK